MLLCSFLFQGKLEKAFRFNHVHLQSIGKTSSVNIENKVEFKNKHDLCFLSEYQSLNFIEDMRNS